MICQPEKETVLAFLREVDNLFPISLSHSHDLSTVAEKLCLRGTIAAVIEQDKIVSIVAGYTDYVINNKGYISVVATLPQYAGRGYAKALVKEFLEVADNKLLDAVHLYAHADNKIALQLYEKIGFEIWAIMDEPRPKDVHLIYWINRK